MRRQVKKEGVVELMTPGGFKTKEKTARKKRPKKISTHIIARPGLAGQLKRSLTMEITHDVKLSALKPHPLNAEIYGEPDKKLVEDIKKNGLLTPIVINSKNIIISGHRRWKAMLALGFTATDAISTEGRVIKCSV